MSLFRDVLRFLAGNERLTVCLRALSTKNSDLWNWFLVLSSIGMRPGQYLKAGYKSTAVEAMVCYCCPIASSWEAFDPLMVCQLRLCTISRCVQNNPGITRLHAIPFNEVEQPLPSVSDLALLVHSLYSAQQDRPLPA